MDIQAAFEQWAQSQKVCLRKNHTRGGYSTELARLMWAAFERGAQLAQNRERNNGI